MLLELTPDEVLTTTRSVRKRLDLTRPVEREVLEACLRIAQQAPTAGNTQTWHFVVVEDAATKAALADLYRKGGEDYLANMGRAMAAAEGNRPRPMHKLMGSALYLAEHLQDVPVLLVPAIEGRLEAASVRTQSALWGTIAPATWSFMLAARARGLGTCWTSFHLSHEREAAELLGIPYAEVTQVALVPVAYTVGTDFAPAPRKPLETMVHWGKWD